MSSRILYRSSGSSRSLCGPKQAPPMLRTLPTLPMDRIEPAQRVHPAAGCPESFEHRGGLLSQMG